MSKLEQPFKLLTVDDDIVVKIPEGTSIETFDITLFDASESSLYVSARELNDQVLESISKNFNNPKFLEQGIEVKILEPGEQWKTGKIRCRVVFEFIPDELENNKISGDSVSSLDELRNMQL